MATPVLQTDWNDFTWFLHTYLGRQTIPTLRQFADKIYELGKVYVPLRSQERKADVLMKVQHAFQGMKTNNELATYARVRQTCEMIGTPARPQTYTYQAPPPTFGGVPVAGSSSSHHHVPRPSAPSHLASNGYGHSYAAPAAGPSRPASGYSSTSYQRPAAVMQDWKPNPLWKPIKALTNMEMLPDISANENSHVRRERRTNFQIPNDVIEKLNHTRANPRSHPRYAVRLFCTSSDHYRPSGMPIQPGQGLVSNRNIPIEYPSNPDVSVDNYNLSFKEKGLRGKAGSAPPFDLEKGPNGLSRVPGRMTTVTVGHSGPTVGKKKEYSKRFFYQIVFAEMTSKDELYNRLKSLEPTNAEDTVKESQRRLEEDDDIVVGTSMMSLKDPLSYMRIARPVRSSKCTHIQCFDAQWWIESNTQHPQWLCPHCSKELKFSDLIVDGYVMSILNAVPDSVEDVVLEPSGEWHTEDNKYGSDTWLAKHGNETTSDTKPDVDTSRQSSAATPPEEGLNAKRKIVEVLLSDSEDDDDQPLSKSNRSMSVPPPPPTLARLALPSLSNNDATASSSRTSSVQPVNVVIDLTLSDSDDDDEEEGAPSTSQSAYFHQPGAVSATRNAVESHRPPMNMKTSNGHIQQENAAARGFSGGVEPGAPSHWSPYDTHSPNQWRETSYQPSRPPSTVGYGGGQGMNKRPRADDWMDGSRQNDDRLGELLRPPPARSAPPLVPPPATNGGFAGYASPLARTFGEASLPPMSPRPNSFEPQISHPLPVVPSLGAIGSSPPRLDVNFGAGRIILPPLRLQSQTPLPLSEAATPHEGTRHSNPPESTQNPTDRSPNLISSAIGISELEPSTNGTTDGMSTPVPPPSNPPSSIITSQRAVTPPPVPVQAQVRSKEDIEREGGGEEPMSLDGDETEDEERAEKSSDLGLGLGEVEEVFWDGVLSGDLVL
ncbi:hypothetical protein IAR55_001315 [Kwoniella newhampshirensis]|uniref:SP-RING-type domain-containing protein n=1 Tax=Kwoniella newhampshirensis TaxID=1651941 RepID=A0AAW0Z5B5_9TREE